MNAIQISIARLNAFLTCALAAHVATSTIAADIAAVEADAVLAATAFWRPRLACARRMLAERRRKEAEFSASCREVARKRHLANRAERAEANRALAAGMGAGRKKKAAL